PTGDTITVDPGTYTEQVTISKSLTLTGAGQGTDPTVDSIIQSPPTLNVNHNRQSIVTIDSGANVTMSDFTVTGPVANAGAGPSGIGIDFGILAVGAATLNLSATTVTDILFQGALNTQQTANGIGVGDSTNGQVGHANISDVTVMRYNKLGFR